ncbi:hypothetical protein [Vescimonas sp.]|uniref:hypothetical protein n=1 Tax=Vescimonas sp. TaxID=2892404 RepID=UPI003F7EAD4D
MKCAECGLELMIYSVKVTEDGTSETDYVCRNPRCVRFDRRLEKKKTAPAADTGGTEG